MARRVVVSKIPVTVILPVKNDAQTVANSLARLQRFQKIVVVDSDSKDGTDEVAAAHGAEYVVFNWNGKPPKKRTWYLNNHEIETDWVLFLDADELVNDAFCDEVERATASGKYVGFWMSFHNWFMEKWLQHGDPFSKLALFRPDAGRYEQVADSRWTNIDVEVHEHPILDGAVGRIQAPAAHDERRGLDSYIGKHNNYSTWEAHRFVAIETEGDGIWDSLTRRQKFKYKHVNKWWFATTYFVHAFILKKGFLDGRAGFVFASLKREYYSHIRLKILELQNRTSETAAATTVVSSGSEQASKQDVPVTVVVTADDGDGLDACLERLKRFQEVVVLDSGRDARITDVAREHGATCVTFESNPEASNPGNWFLENHDIRNDWVLFLGSDDLATDAFCDDVRRAATSGKHVGYWIRFHEWFQGSLLRHGEPTTRLSLFRHDAGRFEEMADGASGAACHERPVLKGTIGQVSSPMQHMNCGGLEQLIKKHNESSTWEARRYLAAGTEHDSSRMSLSPHQQYKGGHVDTWWFKWIHFLTAFVLKLGFLDGRAGFIFASLRRQYHGHIRLKMNESRDSKKKASDTLLP